MSVLEEAPGDRQPIQTFVCEYNEELVREAIVRELSRVWATPKRCSSSMIKSPKSLYSTSADSTRCVPMTTSTRPGSEGRKPKLNRLGGEQWNKTKSRVKSAVKEIAADLVKLYAARQQAAPLPFQSRGRCPDHDFHGPHSLPVTNP